MQRRQSARINAWIEPEVMDAMQRIAWERNITVAAVAREVLCAGLDIEPRVWGPAGRPPARRLELAVR